MPPAGLQPRVCVRVAAPCIQAAAPCPACGSERAPPRRHLVITPMPGGGLGAAAQRAGVQRGPNP
eukprot:scaffold866_cov29-Phaeocystis_antarctica.AAC.1